LEEFEKCRFALANYVIPDATQVAILLFFSLILKKGEISNSQILDNNFSGQQ
jgi:hypothetical protein